MFTVCVYSYNRLTCHAFHRTKQHIMFYIICCVGNEMFNQFDDDKFNSNRCLTMIMNFYIYQKKEEFLFMKFQLVFNISSLRLANRFVTL